MNKLFKLMLILIACFSMSLLQAIDYQSLPLDELTALAQNNDAEAQLQLGLMYYHGLKINKNYQEAHNWFLKAAKQGLARAQFHMGTMYYIGLGVKQDYNEAFNWMLLAAIQGDPRHQNLVGMMYDKGEGVKQNYIEARRWYTLAAEQGLADAQYNLGTLFYEEEYKMENHQEARKLFLKAAEQGHANAHYQLGLMYLIGHGVIQDLEKSYFWFVLAATFVSQDSLEDYVNSREMVGNKISHQQREKAKKQAREWIKEKGLE
ncbi:MAG: sel1 repeat family protein [Candidatus Cloacimonetes bacterium]|nr:sel1 repeat family protein [Candidatus Cloacimonadota bacterium]